MSADLDTILWALLGQQLYDDQTDTFIELVAPPVLDIQQSQDGTIFYVDQNNKFIPSSDLIPQFMQLSTPRTLPPGFQLSLPRSYSGRAPNKGSCWGDCVCYYSHEELKAKVKNTFKFFGLKGASKLTRKEDMCNVLESLGVEVGYPYLPLPFISEYEKQLLAMNLIKMIQKNNTITVDVSKLEEILKKRAEENKKNVSVREMEPAEFFEKQNKTLSQKVEAAQTPEMVDEALKEYEHSFENSRYKDKFDFDIINSNIDTIKKSPIYTRLKNKEENTINLTEMFDKLKSPIKLKPKNPAFGRRAPRGRRRHRPMM